MSCVIASAAKQSIAGDGLLAALAMTSQQIGHWYKLLKSRDVVRQLRVMAKEEGARSFFGWLSEYQRNAESSTVDLAGREATRWGREHVNSEIVIGRGEIITIMRRLEELQLGRFIVGRRKAPSRFEFWNSRAQIGQAALGQINVIDIEEEPVSLDQDDLIEAHRMLIASALGRPISAITIKVKEEA